MNIILINHYAGAPEFGMEYRPYYMAREWVEKGHNVLIVGASFSHLRKTQPGVGEDTIDGIDYLWLETNEYNGNGFARFRSMLAFVRGLYKKRKAIEGFKPDVIIASSTYPLDIYPARRMARETNSKLIFEIHDLWPLYPIEMGKMSERHPFIVLMQRAEDYAYKYCDKCVSILPCVHEHVKAHGLDLNKLVLVPNGVFVENPLKYKPLPDRHNDIIQKLKSEGKFLVCFAGTHGMANALPTLIEGVRNLSEQGVTAILVGRGLEKGKLKQYVLDNKISNVVFLESLTKAQIPTLLGQMDVLYLGLQKVPLFRFGRSPNKIFDYMLAAKPIIQAIEAGNDIVKEANCGLSIPAQDPKAVEQAVLKIKNMSEEERNTLGAQGKVYVLANHTYTTLAADYLEALV